MYMHIYIYVHIYIYIFVYIYIHMHVHVDMHEVRGARSAKDCTCKQGSGKGKRKGMHVTAHTKSSVFSPGDTNLISGWSEILERSRKYKYYLNELINRSSVVWGALSLCEGVCQNKFEQMWPPDSSETIKPGACLSGFLLSRPKHLAAPPSVSSRI